jgi:hypothetical protein
MKPDPSKGRKVNSRKKNDKHLEGQATLYNGAPTQNQYASATRSQHNGFSPNPVLLSPIIIFIILIIHLTTTNTTTPNSNPTPSHNLPQTQASYPQNVKVDRLPRQHHRPLRRQTLRG